MSVKAASQVLIHGAVAAAVQDAQGADDVLLSHQAGDGSHGRLPVAPAQRDEDPGDQHCRSWPGWSSRSRSSLSIRKVPSTKPK